MGPGSSFWWLNKNGMREPLYQYVTLNVRLVGMHIYIYSFEEISSQYAFYPKNVWFAIQWQFWLHVTYDLVVISTKKKKWKNGKVWKTNDLRVMHASFDLLLLFCRGHAWWRWFYFSHAKATRNGLCLLRAELPMILLLYFPPSFV